MKEIKLNIQTNDKKVKKNVGVTWRRPLPVFEKFRTVPGNMHTVALALLQLLAFVTIMHV